MLGAGTRLLKALRTYIQWFLIKTGEPQDYVGQCDCL